MNRRNFVNASTVASVGALALSTNAIAQAVGAAPAAAPPFNPSQGSTMARVMSSGTLRVAGLVGEEPYFHKDLATGAWSGFCIDMATDIAKNLGTKLEVVESTWGNSVLDLQANKIDISFGLNPTPKRAMVIAFSSPLFFNTFSVVTRKGFKPSTWAELNDPKVNIAVDLGSTHELIARRYAPKASITAFKTRDEAILATQSGRADCFVATIFLGLTALKKNPQLGNFVMPTPYIQASVCAAVQYDSDQRFRDFLDAWAVFNRGNGQARQWIVTALDKIGISESDVPAEVTF
ncbi:MAG: transporter substrate-binding domain-containing protein [Variovorax sp.]